jgi:hypothetical protein
MTLAEIIVELRARPSQTVPFAGDALGSLKRGASYAAAKTNSLGVPVFWSGGKLRTASIDIARRLGVEDKVAPVKTHQQAEVKTNSNARGVAPEWRAARLIAANS